MIEIVEPIMFGVLAIVLWVVMYKIYMSNKNQQKFDDEELKLINEKFTDWYIERSKTLKFTYDDELIRSIIKKSTT